MGGHWDKVDFEGTSGVVGVVYFVIDRAVTRLIPAMLCH